ncbi:MAG: endonuclease/exonuclease/phosphatase family protein [Spirochaetota bacterium]
MVYSLVMNDMKASWWSGSAAVLAVILISGCVTAPLPPVHRGSTQDMRALTYNVHFADAAQGPEYVESHAEDVARVVHEIGPDLACLQEVSTVDFPRLVTDNPLRKLLEKSLDQYGWVGSRGASQMAGTSPIVYRLDRYLPIRQGVDWFSDTPMVPDSTDWGNELPRHMNWALFFDARAEQHVFVANVHLDPWSRTANRRAIEAVQRVIHREARLSPEEPFGSVPVILCGDFNEARMSSLRRPLDRALKPVFDVTDGPTRRGMPSLQIDGIYVSEHLRVTSSSIRRGGGASDHHPLVADLRILPAPESDGR